MYKHLYDRFSNWYRDGGNIWLYSDPHFSDAESYEFRGLLTGSTTIDKLDCDQIKSINTKVGKNDTLIILGDIGNIEKVAELRGYKVLIKGNHDTGSTNYKDYFDEVYEGPLYINDRLILSHENLSPLRPYEFNIHGHVHGPNDKMYDTDQSKNVCAEHINYTPISLITFLKQGGLSKTPTVHRVYIDARNEEKKKNKNEDR